MIHKASNRATSFCKVKKVNTNYVVHKRQLPLSLYPIVARGQKKRIKRGEKREKNKEKKKGVRFTQRAFTGGGVVVLAGHSRSTWR